MTKYALTMAFIGTQPTTKIWNTEEERSAFVKGLETANWRKDKIITIKGGLNLKYLCYYYTHEIQE